MYVAQGTNSKELSYGSGMFVANACVGKVCTPWRIICNGLGSLFGGKRRPGVLLRL
jgi:hypothetical protein